MACCYVLPWQVAQRASVSIMVTADRMGPTITATATLITACGGQILYSLRDFMTATFTDMTITLLNSAVLQAGALRGFTAEDLGVPPVEDFMVAEVVTEEEATDEPQR